MNHITTATDIAKLQRVGVRRLSEALAFMFIGLQDGMTSAQLAKNLKLEIISARTIGTMLSKRGFVEMVKGSPNNPKMKYYLTKQGRDLFDS